MDRVYKGIIFTNHALERMQERGVTREKVFAAINQPDRSRYAQEKSAFIYNKTFGQEMVEVVASKNERKEWVVVSVWSRPLWKLKYTQNQYRVRYGFLDWLIDKVLGNWVRKT